MSLVLPRSRATFMPGWVRNDLWRRARAVPSLDLQFADRKSLVDAVSGQNLITFTRSSNGTYVDSQGVLQTAATNEPRFDHNPTTGESLGLLVEEQRTNSIRNNMMVGAVVGAPGTLPTNWAVSVPAGLTTNVAGIGTQDGVVYVDLRITGTANAASYTITPELLTQTVASQGQTWTFSAWLSLVSGNFANASSLFFDVIERNSVGTQLTAGAVGVPLPSARLERNVVTRTLSDASTAYIQPRFRFTVSNGASIDFTLRIGMPQLEQGAFATSVIPTTGSAATRNADVASITGANFSSWYNSTQGSIFTEPVFSNTASFNTVYCLGDGTASNRARTLQWNNGSNRLLTVDVGGVSQVGLVGTGGVGSFEFAVGLQADNYAVSQNGATPLVDMLGSMCVADKVFLGSTDGFVFFLNGTLKRFTYWPSRLPNSTLQELTR